MFLIMNFSTRVWDRLRIFICPSISGVCPSIFSYKSANRDPFEQTYLFVYKLVWTRQGQQIVLICGCCAYVCIWVAVALCQQTLPALNYTALQNAKLICHNKTIVNMLGFVMFNAALWSNAVSTYVCSVLCCYCSFELEQIYNIVSQTSPN